MKKYTVTVTLISKVKVQVEANSPQEAEETAHNIEIRKIEEMAYEQGGDIFGYEADALPIESKNI